MTNKFSTQPWLTYQHIIDLDLPSRNRVEALLQTEFLSENQLRELACDFAEHTLHIFGDQSPRYYCPYRCIEVARLCLTKAASLEDLQAAISDAISVIWRFEGTELTSAFEAGLAVTFLNCEDAQKMCRLVALYTQRAAHHKEWENRESNIQPMFAREKEAAWQLAQIIRKLR